MWQGGCHLTFGQHSAAIAKAMPDGLCLANACAAAAAAHPIPQVTSSAGMATRMAFCNLGAAGPMLRQSAGMRICTAGLVMAACHTFPTNIRASLLLLRGIQDSISTSRSTDRSALHNGAMWAQTASSRQDYTALCR